jgi:hypothetical protein
MTTAPQEAVLSPAGATRSKASMEPFERGDTVAR